MQRTNRLAISAATVALIGASTLAAPVAPSAQPAGEIARIYVSLPREGQGAASAAQIAKGLRVALADRKATAGGRKIRIVWMNDAKGPRWNAALVRANARRAAADPTAVAYVGEGNSEATAVSMPIVNRAGLVHLSPVSTATALTDAATAGRYQPSGVQTFFRPVPGDVRQSAALRSAVRRAGVRKRVVLVDDGSLYGRGLTQGFAAGAVDARIGVVARYVADRDGKGLAKLAERVAAHHPTAIVYGGAPSSNAAKVLRALHGEAPRSLLFGGDAVAHDDFVARLGRAQARVRITTPAAHVDPRKKTGRDLGARPDPFAVFAYNGMQAVLRGIDRAARRGPITRESVRASVFDGSIQSGLSGAWKITDRGDSVYGVYDILRAANGRIVTPVDRLTDKLVRAELAKRNGRATGRATRVRESRASARSVAGAATRTTGGVGSLTAMTIQSMDIETALMMVQSERTRLLDAQLQQQIQDVQNRNDQIARLNDLLGRLNLVSARFPADSMATTRLDGTGTPERYATDVAAVRAALLATGIDGLELGLATDAAGWTRGAVDAAITAVKGKIDAAGNSQQMDMLRLQSLSNKRNEAFDVMTSFIKKMQEARASIIGNVS